MKRYFFCAWLLAMPAIALGQESAPAIAPAGPGISQPPVVDDAVILPAMLPVSIEITEALNSKTSKIGQLFDIRLRAPITVDGKVIIPAGATGKGQVIHAARARAAGKAGELIIAARYLEHEGVRVPLRSLKYGADMTGDNNAGAAIVASAAISSALALFITGGQVDIPAGMPATAKLSQDVRIIQSGSNLQEEVKP
ncbi:MAG: hypothetical protein C0429_00385 [Sphingopyxis sp.]|nr:hypothetical protein [Sphingopyxis sp.]